MVSGKKTLGDTMKEKLKSILRTVWSWRRWPYLLWLRRRVKNRRFLLIASDCNGGLLLHDLGMQFTMPTVNMAFHRFEKLCTHLDEYLAMTPVPMDAPERSYPMFTLGEAVIEGTHYKSREEFLAAWERRLQRFNACRAQGYEILLMATKQAFPKTAGWRSISPRRTGRSALQTIRPGPGRSSCTSPTGKRTATATRGAPWVCWACAYLSAPWTFPRFSTLSANKRQRLPIPGAFDF